MNSERLIACNECASLPPKPFMFCLENDDGYIEIAGAPCRNATTI